MSLWTLQEVLSATGGKAHNIEQAQFDNVSIDSRDLGENPLFFAIKGDRFDGHDFAAGAIENGAVAAVVAENQREKLDGLLPLIFVDDTLKAMEDLGKASRQRSNARIAAVTGSVGKTSTKEAIRCVLEAAGKAHASILSFNNHWGVPLMLARMPRDTEYAVFEIGMNHADEIRPLVKMVRPDVALVTNIGPAHIGNFDDIYGIVAAKAEIFEGLERGGVALIGADHDYVEELKAAAVKCGVAVVKTFGLNREIADGTVENIVQQPQGLKAQLFTGTQSLPIELPQFSDHAVANALAAAMVGELFEIDATAIAAGLAIFSAPEGRGELTEVAVSGGTAMVLDESYNANPVSMGAAFSLLARLPVKGRKIAVLGDMLELGGQSAKIHSELSGPLLASGAHEVILVGPEMAHLRDKIQGQIKTTYVPDTKKLDVMITESLAPGDLVMFKGSKGIGLSPVVANIKARLGGAKNSKT